MLPTSGAAVPFRRRLVAPGIVLGLLEDLARRLSAVGRVRSRRSRRRHAAAHARAGRGRRDRRVVGRGHRRGSCRCGRRCARGATASASNKELAARAYRISLKGPRARVAAAHRRVDRRRGAHRPGSSTSTTTGPPIGVAALVAIAAVHSYVVSCVRALWTAQVLGEVRGRLFASGSPLKKFDESHFRRFVLVAMIVAGGVLAAQAAFAYLLHAAVAREVPAARGAVPRRDRGGARRVGRDRARDDAAICATYLAASRGESVDDTAGGGDLPARAGAAVSARAAHDRRVVRDRRWSVRSSCGCTSGSISTTCSCSRSRRWCSASPARSTSSSWHRDVLRPLLAHLTQRYRVPVRSIGPTLSMRSKLMLSFGGVVLLACGMALLWGVRPVQEPEDRGGRSTRRQLNLDWSRRRSGPSSRRCRRRRASPRCARRCAGSPSARHDASAVDYYVDRTAASSLAVGGGPMGAPKLPWYVRASDRARPRRR